MLCFLNFILPYYFLFHHSATTYRALAIKNVKMEKKSKGGKTHERKKAKRSRRRKIKIVPGILFREH